MHANAYCKFGIARRNEAISADGLTNKLWAIVSKSTYSNQGRVFTSIQISWGNLNKVPAIASIKQEVISSLEDIASNSKVYIDKKAKYVMQMQQLSTGNGQHD